MKSRAKIPYLQVTGREYHGLVRRAIAIAMFLALAAGAYAQIHGTPPSITGLRPGFPTTIMPPPSITSLGPLGMQGNRFGPNDYPPFSYNPPYYHGRHLQRRLFNGGYSYAVPYYVPYAVSDADSEEGDPDPPEVQRPPQYRPAPVVAAQSPGPDPPSKGEEQPTTILVFRDGHRLEVTNYAISGDQILNLSGNGPRHIALGDLDLPATQRLNDDRGIEFRLPSGS
jgi:hypothetical protein